MATMYGNAGPNAVTDAIAIWGDVALGGGSSTATTAPINELVGKSFGVNAECVAVILSAGAAEYVQVTSLSPSGEISFSASTTSGENRTIMYHVWITEGEG